MIYVYAITAADAELPNLPGLEDQPLGLATVSSIAAVYSRHERHGFDPEPTALWRHDEVVEGAMAGGTVLPARFGTTFDEIDALRDALERDAERLQHGLEEVRGCVELAVRISLPAPAPPAPRSGQEYVLGELARRRERGALADRTLVPLEAHAVRSRTGPAEQADLTASYLVRADAVEGFAEEVKALARRNSELALSCTGPWPPYSFVGQEEQ